MNPALAVAFGSLSGTAHLVRIMANRGLMSPNEVDEIYGSMLEGIQGAGPEFAATIEPKLEAQFAEFRQWAEKLWIGKGKSNPR